MIFVDDQLNRGYNIAKLELIKSSLTDRDVELVLVDNVTIQELNKEYRDIDKPTDVLSFPLEDVPHMPLGTIVISVDKVKEKALELGHSEEDEFTLLFIHGLLHLLGYDHEVDDGEMRLKEKEIIKTFNLPDSLILRNE
jgi:probable rRNA maturation factor